MKAVVKSWALASLSPAILLVDDDSFHSHARTAALESVYPRVVRASGAAEAFILVDQPAFARELALVVVALHMPGLSGPAFVSELTSRTGRVPVLVLCRQGECSDHYSSENVQLLPASSAMPELLRAVREILLQPELRIA